MSKHPVHISQSDWETYKSEIQGGKLTLVQVMVVTGLDRGQVKARIR